jgi:hypothetical protein
MPSNAIRLHYSTVAKSSRTIWDSYISCDKSNALYASYDGHEVFEVETSLKDVRSGIF